MNTTTNVVAAMSAMIIKKKPAMEIAIAVKTAKRVLRRIPKGIVENLEFGIEMLDDSSYKILEEIYNVFEKEGEIDYYKNKRLGDDNENN